MFFATELIFLPPKFPPFYFFACVSAEEKRRNKVYFYGNVKGEEKIGAAHVIRILLFFIPPRKIRDSSLSPFFSHTRLIPASSFSPVFRSFSLLPVEWNKQTYPPPPHSLTRLLALIMANKMVPAFLRRRQLSTCSITLLLFFLSTLLFIAGKSTLRRVTNYYNYVLNAAKICALLLFSPPASHTFHRLFMNELSLFLD